MPYALSASRSGGQFVRTFFTGQPITAAIRAGSSVPVVAPASADFLLPRGPSALQRGHRVGAGDSVDRQAFGLLERAHRGVRLLAELAVDSARVEAERREPLLQVADRGAFHGRLCEMKIWHLGRLF